jgi:hypothetical protein
MDKRLLDKEWRIDNLYKIRNKEGQLIKFVRNRAQKHYGEHKWFRNLVLKSRQLGFTTYEAIDSLDDVLFTPNMDALMIAHNLESGESIFNKKISFAWDKLPAEIRQLYSIDNKTSKTLKFDFGTKGFSSIAVDTSGRSGTYQRVHITELAEIAKKYPKKIPDIIEGTIPAIPSTGRLDVESTSQGASGEFYDMFMEAWERGAPTQNQHYKAHFYNWTWDDEEMARIHTPIPFEDMDQKEKFQDYAEKHKLTQVEITYYYQKWLSLNKKWNALKREYPTTPQEAFDAVSEGTFYGETVGMMEQNGQIGVVPFDRALKVHTVWDLGVGKNMVVGFYQRDTMTNTVRKIDYLEGEGSDGLPEVINKVLRKPYSFGKHFGPHDLEATDIGSGKTRIETARNLGFRFQMVPDQSIEDGINAVGVWLDRLYVDREKCKSWIKSMKNYGREWDEKRGMYKDEPLHNWASHGADEARYAAIVENKMTNDGDFVRMPFTDQTDEWWGHDSTQHKTIQRWQG